MKKFNIEKFTPIDWLYKFYDRLDQAGFLKWPALSATLSYYTAMGVVPFMAICFALAKSFGLEDALTESLNRYFSYKEFDGQDFMIGQLKDFAENLISNYSGSLLAFTALALIFWTGYRLLCFLENVFGAIFGYSPPRRAVHRATDYFTIMVIVPLVLVAAGGVNIYLVGLSNETWPLTWRTFDVNLNASRFFSFLVFLSPYLVWWLVLSWAYSYFSRGLIKWPHNLIGGVVAAIMLQLLQTVYFYLFVALTSYSAIYGSFAAVPLFMIWLYCSWMIVLLGGEITRRLSDKLSGGVRFFRLPPPITWASTVELSCLIMNIAVQNYQNQPQGRPTGLHELSRQTGKEMIYLGDALNRLLLADLLARVSGPNIDELGDGPSFLPTRSAEQLTDKHIREALEQIMLNQTH